MPPSLPPSHTFSAKNSQLAFFLVIYGTEGNQEKCKLRFFGNIVCEKTMVGREGGLVYSDSGGRLLQLGGHGRLL